MRLLFSLCFAAASLSSAAQSDDVHLRQQFRDAINKRLAEERVQNTFRKAPDTSGLRPTHPLATRKAPGVYALPQDNMPCVVPDTKDVAAIPNAAHQVYPYREDMPKKSPKPGEIPNATPFKLPKAKPDAK